MEMSIGNSYWNNIANTSLNTDSKTKKLEEALKNTKESESTDEELLEVCKSFETYFVEQVFKEMKSSVHSSDEEGDYMKVFGDMLTQGYAEQASERGELGIAQMLYESMKRQ